MWVEALPSPILTSSNTTTTTTT